MTMTSIPESTQVLVIGGGPGGSYAAAALSREGIDVIVLEAETFPRYHIGESMLASMRHFLRFIDLDEKFNTYGFQKKVGAAFKLNGQKREGFLEFRISADTPENYAWNVIRSEADHLIFTHAASCGALTFDGTKVTAIEFGEPGNTTTRPVAVTYTRKASDGRNIDGRVAFTHLIDASGRVGLLSARYLKTRVMNQGLKNVASWGYYTGCGIYAEGTSRGGSPFFEALLDESGWAWFIPLHNGTTSIGVVMNEDVLKTKKRTALTALSATDFFLEQLKLAPGVVELIGGGVLQSEVKSASDYSYCASSYAGPGYRIVGDAGAFIDPYFSSGVHLALLGGLAAAASICASMREDCTEAEAATWHSDRIALSYTRFLIVVLAAYKQIRAQHEPVLADVDEDNFDRAFALFRPVIQGTADVDKHLSQAELARTIDFCLNAFQPPPPQATREAVVAKLSATSAARPSASGAGGMKDTKPAPLPASLEANLNAEERKVLDLINARRMTRMDDMMHIANFGAEFIGGFAPRVERGRLGLMRAGAAVAGP